VWQPYRDRGLVVIGISADTLGGETDATVRQFVAQTGVTFPIAWDAGSYNVFRGGAGQGISPYPLDVVIDPDGRIAYLSREFDSATIQAVIEAVLP